MSAILLPLIAAGGIYLAIDAFSKKTKKHRHHDSSSSSTRSHRTESSTTTETDSSTKSAPIKSRRRRRRMKEQSPRHLFSLGLNRNKSKSKRKDNKGVEKSDRKLFVFYSFGEKNKDWDYKNLPSTWKMKRRVLSVNRTNHYNNVDVFTGEKKYQDKMREYLEKAFRQLKANGIIKEYKIRGINTAT
jgi:hypothetical protein